MDYEGLGIENNFGKDGTCTVSHFSGKVLDITYCYTLLSYRVMVEDSLIVVKANISWQRQTYL